MQVGMIGLGRMGANMTVRLLRHGHECLVYDADARAVERAAAQGAAAAASLEALVAGLVKPRAVWLMLPAATVDTVLDQLVPLLEPQDVVVDGGNSYYRDDLRRAAELKRRGIQYLDVGVSGGVWGLDRGYCLMIGGEPAAVAALEPIFSTLAPGVVAAPRTVGSLGPPSPAEQGFLHCGPAGAGHFVKMVHNGIEYGLMAAYAEGLNILRHANVGVARGRADAETSPVRCRECYQYEFPLADVAELWRRGSVIGSWLLDLTATALRQAPDLAGFQGTVSDSGEGRWTVEAAVDEGVPAPAISAALFARFSSRGNDDFADRLLSAMRYEFGGHQEPAGSKRGGG